MPSMPTEVHGQPSEHGVQGVRDSAPVTAPASPVVSLPTPATPAYMGWKCPSCSANYAPTVKQCLCSTRRILVPRHVIASLEEDVAKARKELTASTRIPRGSFVLHYIERVLEVVKNERV